MQHFDPQTILRDELGELRPYAPEAGSYAVRLDANEAPPLLSDKAKKLLVETAGKVLLERYPDASQKELRKAIAKNMGVDPQRVLAGVGSDEIIALLLTVATRVRSRAPAPTMLTTTPTFVMYRLAARVRGQRVIEVPLDDEWDLDQEALLRAVEMGTPNLIFIASPNNPTGTLMSASRLEALATAAKDSLIVVDEAYINFADRDQLNLLERFENVVILRTLSKVGFAALRVGWIVGHPGLIAELDKARMPYNLPTMSQALATVVLSDLGPEIESIRAHVIAERARLVETLSDVHDLAIAPSQANFLWLRLPGAADETFEKLRKRGVLVRSFHGRGGRLERCLRVTIGTPKQNDQFVEAFRSSL